MSLKLITGPATEPISNQEVRAHAQIDAINAEPAPGVITAALASPAVAGNVDNGAHRYRATFVTSTGETQAGIISAAVTVADKAVNGNVELTAIPLGGALVTSRKLYRTAANGTTYLLLATISNNTATTYTDNIADTSLGAEAPTANTTDDPLLAMLIASARLSGETITRTKFITQTWDLILDSFPAVEIKSVLAPVQSITSIKYLDNDGVLQTLAADQYTLDADTPPGWIIPAYGTSWPSTRDSANAVTVRMVVGYGAASAVPEGIKHWMLIRVKQMYDQRNAMSVGGAVAEFPRSFVDGLLDPYRAISFV